MANMWDKEAEFYSRFAFCELEDTGIYLDTMGVTGRDSVLDVCCGPGRVSIVAAGRGATVTGIDSSPRMLEHANANARNFGVEERVNFRLLDWNRVLPGQNVEKHDVVIASRCGAMMDVEKLSALARRMVGIQIFADAPSLPELLGVLFDGCGKDGERDLQPRRAADVPGQGRVDGPFSRSGEGPQSGHPGPAQGAFGGRSGKKGPGIYLKIALAAHEAGYDPNIRILPERFRKTFATRDEALDWICELKPERASGFEERVALNSAPFIHDVQDGVEFCISTVAALVWWDVRGPARWNLA